MNGRDFRGCVGVNFRRENARGNGCVRGNARRESVNFRVNARLNSYYNRNLYTFLSLSLKFAFDYSAFLVALSIQM